MATTSQDRSGPAMSDAPRGSLAAGLVRSMRPQQWLKNVLVFAAPVAAGVLRDRTQIVHAMIAFGCFCLAASGTYLPVSYTHLTLPTIYSV